MGRNFDPFFQIRKIPKNVSKSFSSNFFFLPVADSENFPAKIYLLNFTEFSKHSVRKKFPQNILCFFFRLPFFRALNLRQVYLFLKEFSSQIAKYPMLLPGFQNFPAKCPKSKIFLRNLPAIRQENKIQVIAPLESTQEI